MTLIAWLVYIPLQILWLPLSVLGAIWVAYKQLVVSSRMGVSQTAVEIINGRWTMDVFGVRTDEAARKLARIIPNTSTGGLWLALFPLWLARQIAGKPFLYPTLPPPEKAGIANFVPSRTVEFDALIAANVKDAAQFVVLGAGLDTRAYGPLNQNELAIFELDQKAVQAYKRENVTKAKIDATNVQCIEVDFADPNWISVLTASSYNPAKRTIFLWEGVTLYLSETNVRDTLSALKANAAPSSVVIADFYSERFLKIGKGKATSALLDATGEGLGLGFEFLGDAEGVLRSFVSAQGLTLGRHQFLGAGNKKGPFMVIAELLI
jgi:hypothetical protein